jgi:phosphoglycerate dehydrogenase-like enzyme
MNIILASSVDPGAVAALEDRHHVVSAFDDFAANHRALMPDCDVLVFRSGVEISRDLLDLAPHLGLIVRAGSGFDNIDLDHAARRGIRVVRIPGPSADAVAEFTFGLMLAVARRIVRADSLVRDGLWPKRDLGGNLLGGKVLGIVGAGHIGSRVGQLGAAWGMDVTGCVDPVEVPWTPPGFMRAGDLDTVLAQADFLTVHTPLTDATRRLIGARELARMKSGAYLVSTARGGVVDEAALYEELASGHLAGAALDVHEHEGDGVIPKLADLPNVVLTPHIGGMALESQRDIGRRMLELIEAFTAGDLDAVADQSELLA